jgi:hypothetical protein
MLWPVVVVTVVLLISHAVAALPNSCDGKAFTFVEDQKISTVIEQARVEYMATRPNPLTRVAATLLLPTANPST